MKRIFYILAFLALTTFAFAEKGISEYVLTVESVDWNCASFEVN